MGTRPKAGALASCRSGRRWLPALALAALAGGCDPAGTDSAQDVDPVTLAAEPGPWRAGHVQADVEYTDIAGLPRTLRTAVWYPTEAESGAPASTLFGTDAGAFEGAVPAAGEFPAVVYSHGHQGYAEASSFLAEHLASHGYIVVAPDHTDNTTLDGSDRTTAIYRQRPDDLRAALDALAAGTFAGAATWNGNAVAIGHSFGGFTAYAIGGARYDLPAIEAGCAASTLGDVCTDWGPDWAARYETAPGDDRIRGVLAMAPGNFNLLGNTGLAAVELPTLLMTGEFDPERTADGALYHDAFAARGGHWLNVVGGAHNTFIDLAGAMGDGQTLDAASGHLIVRTYALAFTASALGDDRFDGILSGELTVAAAASWE